MGFLVAALVVAVCLAISAKQPAASTNSQNEQVQQVRLAPSYLPSDFVFVKDKGHHYFLYRDMSNYYLVWQDDTFARSVHITWLGPVNR
jgi:hypothetical protein